MPERDDSQAPLTFDDVVARRRMVRAFLDTPVDDRTISQLIEQCRSAPSAGNTQSVQLLVLTGTAIDEYWSTTLAEDRRHSFPWPGLLHAPLLIVPYVEPARYVARYAEADKSATGLGEGEEAWPVPYWWVDGGAAVQTLLLGAVASGLSACLFGQFEHEAAIRARFGVPDGLRAIGTVAIGHADIGSDRLSRSARRRKRPASETVHHNAW